MPVPSFPVRARRARSRSAVAVFVVSAAMTALAFPIAAPPPVAAAPGDPCDPAEDPECDPGPETGSITVTRAGAGASHGTVTSSPAGIACGATCTSTFDLGATVTLTATVDTGWSLTGWSGCDSSSGLTCTATATDTGTGVTATFADVTTPSVSLTAPTNSSIHRRFVTVSATASDAGSGVSWVEFALGGMNSLDTAAPYSYTFDTSLLNGPYIVNAWARDAAGNRSFRPAAVSITIDNTAPVGTMTSPATDAVVDGPVELAATASDQHSGIHRVYFEVSRPNGSLVWTPGGDSAAPWGITFDPNALNVADGAYRARASIQDLAGNGASTAYVPFRIDRAAPEIAIDSPAEGTVVETAASLSLAATATDAGGTPTIAWRYAPAGSSTFTSIGTGASLSWDVSGLSDGRYAVQAVATDLAGRQTTATRSITVDRSAPTAAMGALPAYQTSRGFTVSWSGADAGTGVSSYDVQQRNVAYNAGAFSDVVTWQSATAGTSATFTGSPGKTYCFSVRSRDGVGRTSPWSAESCTSVAVDDRAMKAAPSGAWKRNDKASAPDTRYFESTYSRSTKAGATLTRSGVQAKRVAIVVTKCSTCGKVQVRWNGATVRTVDLAATTTQRKRVIEVISFGSVTFGTVTLKQASGGKLVDIDGIAVGKT